MRFDLRFGAGPQPTRHRLDLHTSESAGRVQGEVQFTLDDEAVEANWAQVAPSVYSIIIDGRSYEVLISSQPGHTAPTREGPYTVTVRGRSHLVEVLDPRRRRRANALDASEGPQEILAPMPGMVVKVLVAEGQQVSSGDGLLVIEAMKMQNEIRASRTGRVEKIHVREGAGVETGFKLVRLV
jgi:biotin carboxyl carrier protein